MKKVILISILLLIFAACKKEEQTTQMKKVGNVEKESPYISVTTNISVLKKDNSSNSVFFIGNIEKDYKINLNFAEPFTENDFIISKDYPMETALGISIKPKSSATNAYALNVQVLDKADNELLNETVYFFALKKLYASFADESLTPMYDDEVLLFNNNTKEHYVILSQTEVENYTVIEKNNYDSNIYNNIFPITEYGFTNNFTGSLKENSNGLFTVDNKAKEFVINNETYNNCLIPSSFLGTYPCALKITSGDKKGEAVFYLRLKEKYIDTAINLKSE